jgi:predicted Zn-dependent peptidase
LFQKVLGQTLFLISQLLTGRASVQAEELLRAKNQIIGQHFIAAEDTNTRMSRLATQELYFGRRISTGEIAEKIDAVDVACLENIAQQSLKKNLLRMAVAVVGPDVSDGYEVMAKEAMRTYFN